MDDNRFSNDELRSFTESELEDRRSRVKNQMMTAFALIGALMSLALFLVKDVLFEESNASASIRNVWTLTFAFSFFVALTFLALRYLQGNLVSSGKTGLPEQLIRNDIEEIKILVRDLYAARQKTSQSVFSDSEKQEILSSIKQAVGQQLNTDLVNSLLDDNSLKNILLKSQLDSLFHELNSTKHRLLEETVAITRRGNINLIVGAMTTVAAAAILLYTVLKNQKDLSDLMGVLNYFIPRVSIVIFIEVFSFFFLRLYRANLQDIKFYHNELTNIESRFVALRTALTRDDINLMNKVIETLALTERNFVLQKGQTTVGIEAAKLQDQSDQKLVDGMKWMAQAVFGHLESVKSSPNRQVARKRRNSVQE